MKWASEEKLFQFLAVQLCKVAFLPVPENYWKFYGKAIMSLSQKALLEFFLHGQRNDSMRI